MLASQGKCNLRGTPAKQVNTTASGTNLVEDSPRKDTKMYENAALPSNREVQFGLPGIAQPQEADKRGRAM